MQTHRKVNTHQRRWNSDERFSFRTIERGVLSGNDSPSWTRSIWFSDRPQRPMLKKSRSDGCLEKIVSESLQKCFSDVKYHPKMAVTREKDAHSTPSGETTADSTWLMMSVRRWETLEHANGIAKNFNENEICNWILRLDFIEFIEVDIVARLPRRTSGNVFIIVMTDRYYNLAGAIPTSVSTPMHVAIVFIDHWIYPYGIPDHLLTVKGSPFVSRFFAALCGFLGLKHLKTTAFHPQTYGQAEQ